MAYRTRIKYTDEQKTKIWDRWKRGETLKEIGRAFDRGSSSIYGQKEKTAPSPFLKEPDQETLWWVDRDSAPKRRRKRWTTAWPPCAHAWRLPQLTNS